MIREGWQMNLLIGSCQMGIYNKLTDSELILGLSLIEGLGQVTLRKIISRKKGVDLSLLSKKQKTSLSEHKWDAVYDLLKKIKKLDIKYVTSIDDLYPANLLSIVDYPPVIYYKGNIGLLSTPCISVVGTRKISSYGRSCIERFVPTLIESGITIVSGMAFGVDCYAHKITLECKGNAVAVLASGVDIPSPMSNSYMYNRILASNGLVISELPPGTKPIPGFFPLRNRIISALAMGTLVIEAGDKSGSLITAYSAFNQNREVFSVPGDVFRSSVFGSNRIIRDGIAKLVIDPNDILSEFNYLNIDFEKNKVDVDFKDELEKKIYLLLTKKGFSSLDDIALEIEIPVSALSSILTRMELKGILTSVDSKYGIIL